MILPYDLHIVVLLGAALLFALVRFLSVVHVVINIHVSWCRFLNVSPDRHLCCYGAMNQWKCGMSTWEVGAEATAEVQPRVGTQNSNEHIPGARLYT